MLSTKNIFSLQLRVRALVICSFPSLFSIDLQSAVIARQKQNFITLVKKHPVVSSVVAVGCAVGLGYAMIKYYRKKQRGIHFVAEDNRVTQQAEEKSEKKKTAANKELGEAFLILGRCYQTGVSTNIPKAVTILQRAAEQGYVEAQCVLGGCYSKGLGVNKDVVKAFELFESAAKQGYTDAQYELGRCYLASTGVRKNLRLALGWFGKAADNGHLDSQILVCHIARNGILIPKNDALADTHFERVAKALGSTEAARKKFNESTLHALFIQASFRKGCVGEECSICAGGRPPFQQGDSISLLLPCQHCFCQDCLTKWFVELRNSRRPLSCPLCRRVVQKQQVVVGTAV